MPTVSRRGFVGVAAALGVGTATASSVSSQTPEAIVGISRAESFVPDGYLNRASQPADWSVQIDYGTGLAPSPDFSENCHIQVYPWAVNSETAWSQVLVSQDLDASPNRVLIQIVEFKTENLASSNFDRISRDCLNIFSTMLITKTEAQAENDPKNQVQRHELSAMNGWCKALHVERRGSAIGVVRAGQTDTPPWDFIDRWVDVIFDSPNVRRGLELDGNRWELSYGPFDFHPSSYEDPPCG